MINRMLLHYSRVLIIVFMFNIISYAFITKHYGIGNSTVGDIKRNMSKLEVFKNNRRYGHEES